MTQSVRPLRYLLSKLGYVKLSELDLILGRDGIPRPMQKELQPYSFMFLKDSQPPCRCQTLRDAPPRASLPPLSPRARLGSQPVLSATRPVPSPAMPFHAQPDGLHYDDHDTQIMEGPTVHEMPSFMHLKI